MSLAPGARVRVRAIDPPHHTRAPRYARGQTGEVLARAGRWPLPDDVARQIRPPRVEDVYEVRFPAAALWGEGAHTVVLELWESYLEEVG